MKRVFITGGGGYVGSMLVPQLLAEGYRVAALDLFLYGKDVMPDPAKHPGLELIEGDLRDQDLLRKSLRGADIVIHLACISNDPSFELNPELGKTINFDAFAPLVQISRDSGVKRFIYASSSSVYGVKEEENVTEELSLEPLTDYSKFKALCEDHLRACDTSGMEWVIIRPATLCGYAPRLRLDLSVNILTNQAVNKGKISVFGGSQQRPNLNIEDMCDLYRLLCKIDGKKIHGQTFNAGYENLSIDQIAELVKREVGPQVQIDHVPTNDLRSYRVSSRKIGQQIGFAPTHSISDAVKSLQKAFSTGLIPDSFSNSRYFNIKRMQEVHLK